MDRRDNGVNAGLLGENIMLAAHYMIAVGYPDETPDARPRDLSKISFVK